MSQIFISYSRNDAVFATRLSNSLIQSGIDVWIDLQDIHAGSKWSNSIQQGLDQSQAMILIVSPDSMASENVSDEWQYFLDHKKPVVPVMLKPTKIHFQLNRIQYIDFNKLRFEAAFEKLELELVRQGIIVNLNSMGLSPDLPISNPPFAHIRSTLYSRNGQLAIAFIILAVVTIVVLVSLNIPNTPTTSQSTFIASAVTFSEPGGGAASSLAAIYTEPFQPENTFLIRVTSYDFVNLRSGPGIEFEVIATGAEGQIYEALAQARGFDVEGESIVWYQIVHAASGRKLWISSSVVEVENTTTATLPPPPTLPGGGGVD